MNFEIVPLAIPKNKKRYVRFALTKSGVKWQESDDLKHWTWIKEKEKRRSKMSDRLKQIKSKLFVDGEVFYHGDVQDLFHEIDDLTAELTRLNALNKRLKEDTERLAEYHVDAEINVMDKITGYTCNFYDCLFSKTIEDIPHTPDCLITLHRALMKELE